MDLNKIHYFFKAVEYKNFTQAANACHIGQTTMSKYIAVLEQELQTQLFIREHRTQRFGGADPKGGLCPEEHPGAVQPDQRAVRGRVRPGKACRAKV